MSEFDSSTRPTQPITISEDPDFFTEQMHEVVRQEKEDVSATKPSDIQIIDVAVPVPSGRPCNQCGSTIERADRYCTHCGLTAPPLDEAIDRLGQRESRAVEKINEALKTSPPPSGRIQEVEEKRSFLRCKQCSAEIATDPDQRSYVCPFCDSTYVMQYDRDSTGRYQPEFVIGFAVTIDQAKELFDRWIRHRSWFHPKHLHRAEVAQKLTGVYLPFWSFSMLAQSSWRANIGEYWYRTETYQVTDSKGNTTTHTRQVRETEWWNLAGKHHRYYSGYLVSGSRGLPQETAYQVMPFNLPALKRYEPYFLAGWKSEEYYLPRDDALHISKLEFQRRENENVEWFLPGDQQRNIEVKTDFQKIESDLCLLPFYLLSYQYEKKLYRFVINGQTGKIHGQKPYSLLRIIAIVVGILLLLFALFVVMSILINGVGR